MSTLLTETTMLKLKTRGSPPSPFGLPATLLELRRTSRRGSLRSLRHRQELWLAEPSRSASACAA